MILPNIGRLSGNNAKTIDNSSQSALRHSITLWTWTTVLNGCGVSKCGTITNHGSASLVGHFLGLPVSAAGGTYSSQKIFHTLVMLLGPRLGPLEASESR